MSLFNTVTPVADLQSADLLAIAPDIESTSPFSHPSQRASVLFIDASVADVQTLVEGAKAKTEVHLLQPGEDAIAQITNTLLGRSGIESLQIVSHGKSGGLQLGETWLDVQSLPGYVGQLKSWGAALSEQADILLYGCDVAQTTIGKTFVNQLAQATGADVAASEDLTGSALLGGDWELEYQTGRIEAALTLSPSAQHAYAHILPILGSARSLGGDTAPQSVAIGDINGDRLADIVTTSGSNEVAVRLGNRSGGFGALTRFAIGATPTAVAIADFNGDGKADLVTANGQNDNISVLLNNGTGGFNPATNFAMGNMPRAIAIGDFNGDRKADIVTANNDDNTVSVRLGTGTGSFGAVSNFAVGPLPTSVAIADFNGDGKMDIVTGNNGLDTVSILLGTGTGSFGGAADVKVGINPSAVKISDFNGDGKADIATANFSSNDVSIRLGVGDGSFGLATHFAAGLNPRDLSIGDLNGDGKLDIVTANGGDNSVSLLLGNVTGGFDRATNFAVGTNPYAVAIGDLNIDGKADIVTANLGSDNISMLLALPKVTVTAGITPAETGTVGTFTLTLDKPAPSFSGLGIRFTTAGTALNPSDYSFTAGSNITSINSTGFVIASGATTATLNVVPVNDGIIDPGETVNLTLVEDNGYFLGSNATAQLTAATNFSVGRLPYQVATGDFNGDGNVDIVTANYADYNVSVRLGNGLGSFGAETNFSVEAQPYAVTVGDFNGDGNVDVVTGGNGARISVRLGNGTGSFGAATNFAFGQNICTSVAIGDFNGDGKADIVTANYGFNNVSVLLGNGAGSFGTATKFATGAFTNSVAIGDFNSDGKADIAAANSNDNNVSVLLGNGAGSFGAAANFSVTSPQTVAIGDFNDDGNADIVTANNGSNNVSVLLGTGIGSFGAATNFLVGAKPYSVAIGDFNGDGKADLAAANYTDNNVSVIMGTGTGSFSTATNFSVDTSPRSVAIADFNKDGRADIITANYDANNISVLLNQPPTQTLTIVDNPNLSPTISLPGSAIAYAENATAVLLDPSATVSDNDSANFNTGQLTVRLIAGATGADRLSIRNQGTAVGQIGIAGSNITFAGVTIGTFTGGTGITPLVITFNNSSNPINTQALLRNLTYENSSDTPSTAPRTVELILTDGDGGTSTPVTRTIDVTAVNDLPTGTVSISGTTTQGQTLTASNALADLDGLGTITYQWLAAGVNISGATGNSLVLSQAEVGKAITVKASYTDGQGTDESVTSTASNAIANINDVTPQIISPEVFLRNPSTGEVRVTSLDKNQIAISAVAQLSDGTVVSPSSDWKLISDKFDFNGDRSRDLVWFNTVTTESAIWYMQKGNTGLINIIGSNSSLVYAPTAPAAMHVGAGWQLSSVGDLMGDNRPEFLWEDRITGASAIWQLDIGSNGRADINLSSSALITFNNVAIQTGGAASGWKIAGVGNFDNDTTTKDVLWFNEKTFETAVWQLNGTTLKSGGYLNYKGETLRPGGWKPVAIGNIDGLGSDEIILQNGTSVATWNLGSNFAVTDKSVVLSQSLGAGEEIQNLVDLNLDNTLDLVVRRLNAAQIYSMNGVDFQLLNPIPVQFSI
jgi:Domain of unknown function (DUF4347)/FG-GAP-like repeat